MRRHASFPELLLAIIGLFATPAARAQTVLLADSFDTASYGASAFNSTLVADQRGLLAPVPYSVTGYTADYKIQHGNGGHLLMAGWHEGEGLDLHASLNHNFAAEANGFNKPLRVQFDLAVTDSSDSGNWAAFALGSAQNRFVTDAANTFSSLFRLSGGTQQFASGAEVTVSGLSWTASRSTIAVVLSDTAGTGSPFNGNGSVARMSVNGVLAGTYTLAQMGASDGYLSFEGCCVFATYDNLSIALVGEYAPGSSYVWDNGASSSLWNTGDTNWCGAAWVNSGANQAFFTTAGGTITLTESLAAGSVTVGNAGLNTPNITFTNGGLSAACLTVQGHSGNNGAYAGNPTLTLAVPTLSVSGDVAVGRANLVVGSGTVTAGRLISAPDSADWGRVVIQGGAVTVSNGVDGSANTSYTFQLELNGGTLATPFVKTADRELGADNNAWLTFNGGTLKATADNPDFITLYGGNQNAYIGNGGAVIDTDGHAVGLTINLFAGGGGGLTKRGQGTLTLGGSNAYCGATAVLEGTLRLAQPSLWPASRVALAPGGLLDLAYAGSVSVRALVIDGVSLPPGVYGAATHPGRITGTGSLLVSSGFTNVPGSGADDGLSRFRRMKYGFFTHYVFGGTRKSDGDWPRDANDMADRFDAAGFAEDVQSMGVEYVIFTAWHYNVVCLWPSAAMERWMPGHTVNRDLLGDLLDAVRAKGIRVLFYTHPRDGHDMNAADQATTGWGLGTGGYDPDWNRFDRQKWNDFVNDIYADLIERYGSRIDGLFIDEGSPVGDSWRVVDYPRLRQTIKSRQPDLLMMQNYYGNTYSCDIGATEVSYWQAWVPGTDPANWPATGRPMSMVMGSNWSAIQMPGVYAPRYNAAEMFRMTVLRAGVNSTDGGGVNWAAGPYAGGGWEAGVLAQMQQLGAWIAPIRPSLCNTLPSQSWLTPPNATINSLASGCVATRSAADGTEYVHVLTPPAAGALTLPAPADGRGYASARLLASGHPVALVRNADGSLTLTLSEGDAWDANDTVLALTPVSVAWAGADGAFGPGSGTWSVSADNFSGGTPVATRFRGGDTVSFSGAGAANVYCQDSWSVGDLTFAGQDYNLYPVNSPVMTLASGRIDVTNGITATFNPTGSGGPLTLTGAEGLQKTGGGTLVLKLAAAYSGSTVLEGGTLSFASGGLSAGGNVVFQGGALTYLAGNTDDVSARIHHSRSPVTIDTGGNRVAFATALSPDNTGGLVKRGTGTLALAGGTAAAASLVTIEAGTLALEPATAGSVAIPNAGFETPAYAPQGWAYAPSAAGWTFNSSSGTSANGSPWVSAAPEGAQVAFLQNAGALSAEVLASSDGHYRLSFLAANRPGYLAGGLAVTVDGVALAVFQPGELGGGGDFNRFALPAVRLAAGLHTLTFQGLQNGADSGTLVDDIRFTAAGAGALPDGADLALAGASAVFDPGPSAVTLASLAGVAGCTVRLTGTSLVITGDDPAASFAGTLAGAGALTNAGTLRLVGDAALAFTGAFINDGVLDIMTWNGTLPAGFVNAGIVLDRSAVKIDSFEKSGDAFSLSLPAYAGHAYQLQRADDVSGPWENIGPAQSGNNAPVRFTDPAGTVGDRRFYRIMVQP